VYNTHLSQVMVARLSHGFPDQSLKIGYGMALQLIVVVLTDQIQVELLQANQSGCSKLEPIEALHGHEHDKIAYIDRELKVADMGPISQPYF
jgi:hypothetical protein